MSAFVSKVYPDCIQILTDGAIYDDQGVIRLLAPKAWLSKKLPIAITNRSMHWEFASHASETLIRVADRCGTVDDFLDAARAVFIRMKEELENHPDVNATTEFLIACHSETLGFCNMYARTSEASGSALPIDGGYEPFTLVRAADDILAAPHGTVQGRPELAAIGREIMASSAGMARRGADLFELFRQEKVAIDVMPELGRLYAVGGRVDLITVTAERTKMRTLRIWPDKVGETINPFAGTNVAPLTRQQRRAAEREARKRRVA